MSAHYDLKTRNSLFLFDFYKFDKKVNFAIFELIRFYNNLNIQNNIANGTGESVNVGAPNLL